MIKGPAKTASATKLYCSAQVQGAWVWTLWSRVHSPTGVPVSSSEHVNGHGPLQ